MKVGELVSWHDTTSVKRTRGIVIKVIDKITFVIQWSNGLTHQCRSWQIFRLDGTAPHTKKKSYYETW
jgi:hypothetical protein